MRNVIDKSLAERDANIDKMCTHIDKDIVVLGKEVKEVKQKAQVGVAHIVYKGYWVNTKYTQHLWKIFVLYK